MNVQPEQTSPHLPPTTSLLEEERNSPVPQLISIRKTLALERPRG